MAEPISKQARYRARLRAQGLRPVQIWLPDTRRPGFAAQCRRQSLAVAASPGEKGSLDWSGQAAATIEGWE